MRTVLYFIVAFICAFWPTFSLLNNKRHKLIRAQKVFMMSLLCIGLEFSSLACLSIPSLHGELWTEIAVTVFAPLGAFLYFIFLKMATSIGGTRPKDWLMLIPVLVFWGMDFGLNLIMGKEQTEQYILTVLNSQDTGYEGDTLFTLRCTFGYWLGHLGILVAYVSVLIYGNSRLKLYHAQLEAYYSNLKGLASSLDFYVKVFTWIACVTVTIAMLSTNIEGGSATPLTFILVTLAVGLVYFLGHFVVGIDYTMDELSNTSAEKAEVKETGKVENKVKEAVPAAALNSTYSKFSEALKVALDQKIYLEQGIELVSLAERIGTNRTYLSNIIHDEYGQSFAEFINSRRIAYAVELMENATEQYPIRYVAMKCGYSSLQTFYNNFAKFTGGKTPASYLKR